MIYFFLLLFVDMTFKTFIRSKDSRKIYDELNGQKKHNFMFKYLCLNDDADANCELVEWRIISL